MSKGREAKSKVKFVDEYCSKYREVFEKDVRSYEYFREALLHKSKNKVRTPTHKKG